MGEPRRGSEEHVRVPLNLPLKPGTERPRMAGYGPIFVFGRGFLGFLGPRLGGVRFPFPAPESEDNAGPAPAV
jgi:hypothetical protein